MACSHLYALRHSAHGNGHQQAYTNTCLELPNIQVCMECRNSDDENKNSLEEWNAHSYEVLGVK
jgi:hypothetical protein